MTLPIDYHMHPQGHAVKPYTPELLEPWAVTAKLKGLKEIAFTDHDRYCAGVDFGEIERLRERHPDLKIRAGIELDNDPETGRAGRAWVEKNWDRLDFILGSAHYLPGETVMFDMADRKAEFAQRDVAADCAQYIAELNGMLDRGGIDAMSHLDLIKIHGGWKPEGGLVPYFQPLLERIAREGLAIEISTAGWRKSVAEQYPQVDLIRAAMGLGIPFTLASDAHSQVQLAEEYPRLEEMLVLLGVREVATYEGHRRTMVGLG